MTLNRRDREVTERLSVAIERLVASIDALSNAISDRTKQLKPGSRVEMQSLRRLSKLVGLKPKRRQARAQVS